MNVLWSILGQPFVLSSLVFRKLSIAFPIVIGGLLDKRPVSPAAINHFAGWLCLALVILAIACFVLKYIFEEGLGSVPWRLFVVLVFYAAAAAVFYGFTSLSSMITSNTSIPSRYTVPGNKLVN